jgi:hypothetical protein
LLISDCDPLDPSTNSENTGFGLLRLSAEELLRIAALHFTAQDCDSAIPFIASKMTRAEPN